MANMFDPWSPEAKVVLRKAAKFAKGAFKDADPDWSTLAFTGGHHGAYGGCIAHARSTLGLIVFTEKTGGGQLIRPSERGWLPGPNLFAVATHEMLHVAIGRARKCPWENVPDISPSTHQNGSWIWGVAAGWSRYHRVDISPRLIVRANRFDQTIQERLPSWEPSDPIPQTILDLLADSGASKAPHACEHCGEPIETGRTDAKYCGGRCRTAAARARKKAKAAEEQSAAADLPRTQVQQAA